MRKLVWRGEVEELNGIQGGCLGMRWGGWGDVLRGEYVGGGGVRKRERGKLMRKRDRRIKVSGTGDSQWGVDVIGGVPSLSGLILLAPLAVDLLPIATRRSPPRSSASVSSLVLLPRGDIRTRRNTAFLLTRCSIDFIGHFTSREARWTKKGCSVANHFVLCDSGAPPCYGPSAELECRTFIVMLNSWNACASGTATVKCRWYIFFPSPPS